jgi:H+/Cl- antiporter ClcA
MRDSKVMREDSYIIKTLAVVALIFLPISTVSSIFGTQFFSTVTAADPSPNGPTKSSTYVSLQFWIFWIVAIPLTLGLLLGWSLWIRRSQPKAQRWIVDVEKRL